MAYRLIMDTLSPEAWSPRVDRIYQRSPGLRVRDGRPERLAEEVAIIRHIYNSAWQEHWAFTPIDEAEAGLMVRQLKPILVPQLAKITELDGRPVGVALTLPDYNQVLIRIKGRLTPLAILKVLRHRRRITRARVVLDGALPEHRAQGVMAVQLMETGLALKRLCYRELEMGWIVKENMLARRPIERIGAKVCKRYNVYRLEW